MSLRDYFAAAALTAILQVQAHITDDELSLTVGQMMAKRAYAIADAMLREREASHD